MGFLRCKLSKSSGFFKFLNLGKRSKKYPKLLINNQILIDCTCDVGSRVVDVVDTGAAGVDVVAAVVEAGVEAEDRCFLCFRCFFLLLAFFPSLQRTSTNSAMLSCLRLAKIAPKFWRQNGFVYEMARCNFWRQNEFV